MTRLSAPGTLYEYLSGYKNIGKTLRWYGEHVVDGTSRKHLYKMIMLNLGVIFLQFIVQAASGLVLTGFSTRSSNNVLIGVIGTGVFMLLYKSLDRRKNKARELITTTNWGNLDKRLFEMFFSQGAGQHVQGTTLSASAFSRGRNNLNALLGIALYEAIPTLINLTIAVILLLYVSWIAGILMLICILVYVGCNFYLNYRVLKECLPIDRRWRQYNRYMADRLEKVTRIITSSQEKREMSEMMSYFDKTAKVDRRFWFWFIDASRWRNYNNILFYLIVFSYSSHLAWNGEITPGLCATIWAWAKSIIDSIWTLGDAEQKASWALPSVVHMIDTLSRETETPDVADAVELSPTKPLRIVLNNVSYAYKGDDGAHDPEEMEDDEEETKDPEKEEFHTLRSASFTIEPGEKVAVIGPSGAGKTTLERLILRFMDPASGWISVGGVDLRNVKKSSWMNCIGHIAQHPEVFDGTIRENLTYRLSPEERARVTDEELWALMRRLQIDFGKRLDKGLDTKVGKHGLKLSGGQAQRLMIGAAVIGKPWFMVIDEATSSLDSTTERKVQQGLEEILAGETSALIVAHRLSTVRRLCTKFVVLKPAADVAEGESQVEAVASSFEELYRISPTFRQLADDQEIAIEMAA